MTGEKDEKISNFHVTTAPKFQYTFYENNCQKIADFSSFTKRQEGCLTFIKCSQCFSSIVRKAKTICSIVCCASEDRTIPRKFENMRDKLVR